MLQLGFLSTPRPREFIVKGRVGKRGLYNLPRWKSRSFVSCMVVDQGWAQALPLSLGTPIIFVQEDISCAPGALVIVDTSHRQCIRGSHVTSLAPMCGFGLLRHHPQLIVCAHKDQAVIFLQESSGVDSGACQSCRTRISLPRGLSSLESQTCQSCPHKLKGSTWQALPLVWVPPEPFSVAQGDQGRAEGSLIELSGVSGLNIQVGPMPAPGVAFLRMPSLCCQARPLPLVWRS